MSATAESNPAKERFFPATLKGWMELLAGFGLSATAVSALLARGFLALFIPTPNWTAIVVGVGFGFIGSVVVLMWRSKRSLRQPAAGPGKVADLSWIDHADGDAGLVQLEDERWGALS